jgi:O-antigen/teichoic acid export membrane protein
VRASGSRLDSVSTFRPVDWRVPQVTTEPLPLTPQRAPLANFGALGTSELVGRVIGFYATTLLARRLGAEAFGFLGFATAVIAYVGVSLTAGFGEIGSREVARAPGRATAIAADVTAIRVLIALGGTALVVAIGYAFVTIPPQRAVLLAGALSLLSLALDPTWVYRGLSMNQTAASAFLLSQVVYLGGVLALVGSRADVVRVPLIQFAGDLIAATLLLVLLFRSSRVRPRIVGGVSLLRQSGFITASRLIRTVIVTFDVLLLATLTGGASVGLYTAAYRVCMLVTMIAVATHVVYLPGISVAASTGVQRLSSVLKESLALTVSVILPLVVGGIFLARPLLTFLFGAEYAAAAPAFQVLLASIGVLSLHGTAHNVFIALHQTRREMLIFAAAAATNIALNVWLIPSYGLLGAAIATLAAEGLILVTSAFSLYRTGIRTSGSAFLSPVVATATMTVALVLLSDRLPVAAVIAAGGIVYVAVLAATGGVSALRRNPGSAEL